MNNNIPYANLNPDLILTAVESVGYRCSGSLFSLNSYENRVYQIGMESEPALLIAKFYRPHRWSNEAIIEEHQFALELTALEIPVVAPIIDATNVSLHHYQDYRFALFPRQGGRSAELDNFEHLEWLGRFLGRLHAVGSTRSFQHRFQLNVQNHGYQCYHYLLKHNFIPAELISRYSDIVAKLLQTIEQRFTEVDNIKNIRLHGDFHIGNILWSETGPRIVDLDDCLTGPAIQDIWMLLNGNKEQVDLQLGKILQGYQEFHEFDFKELHLIEALRTLRMISYSTWLAKRWQDPAFIINFPWFNTLAYWREQVENLQQQQMLLDESIEYLP